MTLTSLHRAESLAAPLSFAQERLWFLEQINPGDPSANICRAFRIKGELSLALLSQSVQAIVKRHESLRTTFATSQLNAGVDSKPVQLVVKERAIDVRFIDLSLSAPEVRAAEARALARAEAQRSFDLTLGPLLRVSLLKFDNRDHVLLLNAHRIICDEHSIQILIRDLGQSYRTLTERAVPLLSSSPTQLADYAASQQQIADNELFQIHAAYWKDKLFGAPTVIDLPSARARPPIQSWRGSSVTFQVRAELYQALKSIGRDFDTSLFATLTAAFQLLISRYTGQQDVVVGTTLLNRDLPETRDLVGPVANPIALRTDLSGEITFGELIKRAEKEILAAREHGAMPFEKLIKELQVERSLSHAPVFQIAIELRESTGFETWIDGLSMEEFAFEIGIAALDLRLEIVDACDHLNCRVEYAADLFDESTVERLADHFVRLLSEISSKPENRTSQFTFLSPDELTRMLREWNHTAAFNSLGETFCQMFESQVTRTPAAIAVSLDGKFLTYAELNQKANQLAHFLRKRGARPEHLTGIFFDRSLEMVVAVMGTLKAGGAYLPLDISFPAERLSFMLTDASVSLLLTREKLLTLLPDCAAEIICVDRVEDELEQQSDSNPITQLSGGNLAYVIYTSGSTGKPKGVQVSHSSLANFLSSMRERPGLSASDVLLSVTTLSFDIAGLEIYLPLAVGAQLTVARREEVTDGAALAQLIEQSGATVIQATPATWRLLIEAGWRGNEKLRILCGGEALSRDLADQLRQRSAELWNMYGPTETTIWSTVKQISSGDGEIKIGKPIANTQVYVLDAHLQPVPVGVTGELYIGGDGLARGYLCRPGQTAERFIPNPFSAEPGRRLYRTGDLARFAEDGEIEVLGRVDHQVKVRGYRIELGEIESVLNSHALVGQSVVTASNVNGEQQLTVYFVPVAPEAAGAGVTESQLRMYLKGRLPEYMIPQNFIKLEALPLTPNGKIDRRSLPKFNLQDRNGRATYVAPRDNLERQLAHMWETVLGTKPIGLKDNFFDLGGQSLLAARLFAHIENKLGKHIALATLFQAPTVEQLSNVLREMEAPDVWPSLVAIQPKGSRPPLFCIHAAGANVLIYRPLSRHLGNDQPIYALQAQGLDGQTKPYHRVEEMAAHYIREVRAFQPEGPYHLLGASFGGLVVFEMACQLTEQGQQVGLLAMLNTDCPVYTFRKRMLSHVIHLKELGPRGYVSAVISGLRRRINKSGARSGAVTGSDKYSASPDPELQQVLESHYGRDESLVRTVLAIMDAEDAYHPIGKIYPRKITYFRAIDARTDSNDNRLGWSYLARGGFELHDVPGTHTSMREEPRVAVLAQMLKPCLHEAQNG